MPVPKSQITTAAQAYDYAVGSAQAASGGVCPSTAVDYQNLAARVSSGEFGLDTGQYDATSLLVEAGMANAFDVQSFLAELGAVDGRCRMSADYKPALDGGAGGSTGGGSGGGGGGGSDGGILPPASIGSGSNMILWVLGGLGVAILMSPKLRNKLFGGLKKGASKVRHKIRRRRRR